MKGCCPKVPQQPNFSDCGLFLLQYVESLFKSPIKDFSLPIKSLKKWFPNQEMRNKRHDIAELIRKLAAEQHKDKKINFPQITFTPTEGSGYTDDEDDGNGSSTGTSGLGSLMTNKLLGAKTKFLVGKPNTTGTRVIHLTSSKSLSLTPTKSSTGSTLGSRGTSAAGSNNSSGPLMISRKSGKVFLSTLQNQKPETNTAQNQETTEENQEITQENQEKNEEKKIPTISTVEAMKSLTKLKDYFMFSGELSKSISHSFSELENLLLKIREEEKKQSKS